MDDWLKEAFENIDAGFFSGDSFHNEEALVEAEEYMRRWECVIDNIREHLSEQGDE